MGRHASAERRRSVAAWPIVVGVVVLLLVIAVVGYLRFTASDDKDAGACSGTTVLPVLVSPGAAPAIGQAAQAFNATRPEARSTCVSVAVTALPGAAAVTALAGGWRGQASPAPGLWIPDSAADVAALDAARPAMTAGHPTQALATSPVVLAVRESPATPVSWASLAAGSAGLVPGIADPVTNRASAAALQSLVRGASGRPTAAVAIDAAAVRSAVPALTRLAAGSATAPATTDLALTALAAGCTRFTAVPVMESALATFNAAKGTSLTAVYPTGPTVADQIVPIPLTADWVSNAMSDATAAFDAYLGDPAGTAVLTAAHLRTAGASATTAGVDLGAAVTVLPDAGAAVSTALSAAWGAAAGPASIAGPTAGAGPTTSGETPTTSAAVTTAVSATSRSVASPSTTAASTTAASTTTSGAPAAAITFLVDTSGSMNTLSDGAQRLTWVKSAVSTVVQQLPRSSYGLWSFATSTSEAIPLGPLDGSVSGTPRSSAIVAALNRLTPSGNSYTYGAIRTAFTDAGSDPVPAGGHRVILLTDGSDSTPGLSRDAVKAAVAQLNTEHPGLTLDIVGLSSAVNEQALTEIAAAGGGTFTPVTALAGLEKALLTLSS